MAMVIIIVMIIVITDDSRLLQELKLTARQPRREPHHAI